MHFPEILVYTIDVWTCWQLVPLFYRDTIDKFPANQQWAWADMINTMQKHGFEPRQVSLANRPMYPEIYMNAMSHIKARIPQSEWYCLVLHMELVLWPFRHIYRQHGYSLTDECAQNPTDFLVCAVEKCKDYMEIYHAEHLVQNGYETVGEYADFIETHLDKMDCLALLLTAMLNYVLVCIHHASDMWHTHVKTQPCSCSLHLAQMGDDMYVALQKILLSAKRQKKPKDDNDQVSAAPTSSCKCWTRQNKGREQLCFRNDHPLHHRHLPKKAKGWQWPSDQVSAVASDQLKWVHYVPITYPPSCTWHSKENKVFYSAACIAERKAQVEQKQAKEPKQNRHRGPPRAAKKAPTNTEKKTE